MNTPEGGALVGLGAFALDPWRNVLISGEREVQVSPLAARLLQLLAVRPGEVYERAAIIEELWRGDWLVGDPALTRLVSEIRSAVGDDKRKPTLIQTVPRRGYRLVVTATDHADQALPRQAERPVWWQEMWRLANRTLMILILGTVLIMTLALLIRNFR